MKRNSAWVFVLAAAVVACCVLGLYQTTVAAPPKGGESPFQYSAEQRVEMVSLLKDIKELLKEQNELLRSGTVKVIVAEPEKPQQQQQ